MSKTFVIGFIAGVALLIVGGVAGFQLRQKTPEQIREQQELALYQKEIVDATPVQLGVLTERQRIHSRLYTHYQQLTNKTIHEKIANPDNNVSKMLRMNAFVPLIEVPEPETPESYFGGLADTSDAVVRGKAIKKVSQITEDGCFVFTDYDVVVSEVLKNNVTAPIDNGTTITVTRPGGKVLLDGIIVKARDHSFEALPVNNHDVVLFLRLIPETGAYQETITIGGGSFEIDGSTLRPLTKEKYPPGVLGNEDSFLQNIDSFLQTLRVVSDR